MLKIAIISGEPSGDILAAKLIRNLKLYYNGPISFKGIGGYHMKQEGFESSYDMSVLSVGGFGFDVIRSIPKIMIIRHNIIKQLLEFKPDVFIGVDAPDFNLYVESKLKQNGIKTVHYISPTIWAWRYERIFKIKKFTDIVLCVFPMEEKIYAKENIKAKFVGHELANKIEENLDVDYYKSKLNLEGVIFAVLVGSRKQELKNLTKIFIETCNLIAKTVPEATFVFPIVNDKIYKQFKQIFDSVKINFKYRIFIDQTQNVISASDLVLSKSGTVTLEVALCKKPMLISYKVSKLSEWIVRRKIKIKYIGLPNILLDELVVKEILQEDANPENLAREFVNLYQNKKLQLQIIDKFAKLHMMLKSKNNFDAAIEVLNLISEGV